LVSVNDKTYSPLYALPRFVPGIVQPVIGAPSEWSAIRALAGLNMPAADLFGITRPTTAAKQSWGAVQYNDVARSSTQAQAGTYSLKLADAPGVWQTYVPTTNVSTTFTVYVYREANYAGTNPQMTIKQPGQTDTVVTDAAAAGQWNQLTTTLTPAASPGYVVVEVRSNNTATSGSYGVYVDTLAVS
jgi:hypothetical protein